MFDHRMEALAAFFEGHEDPFTRRLREIDAEAAGWIAERKHQELEWLAQSLADLDADIPPPAHLQRTCIELPRTEPDWSEVEWHRPAPVHPYDVVVSQWVALQTELDQLAGRDRLSDAEAKRLAELPDLIADAMERGAAILRRDRDDPEYREHRAIDARRRTEVGKAERRKVRETANENLSHMTDEEKTARKETQKYISNTRARLKKAGLNATEIEAEIARRLQRRAEGQAAA